MGNILFTLLMMFFFAAMGFLELKFLPRDHRSAHVSFGMVIVTSMALIIEIIPNPDITTFALLIYGPIALVAYLIVMWWWRKKHKVTMG